MMMDRLFDMPAVAQERGCGTCAHAVPRHGTHARGTYPLVCLVMACPVSASYEGMAGRKATDWPCRADFDDLGPFPRGWEPRDGEH